MKKVRLHLCCGANHIKGFVNVDKYEYEDGDTSRKGCSADLIGDVFELDFPDGYVDEVVLTHGLEHFAKYDSKKLLSKYISLLSSNGVIYLEHPNRNTVVFLYYIESIMAFLGFRRNDWRDSSGMASSMLWGNQWSGLDYETHRYLWSLKELLLVAKSFGAGHYRIYRYTSTHIPFRDVGLAIAKNGEALKNYSPPTINRVAKSGFFYSCYAFLKSLYALINYKNNL